MDEKNTLLTFLEAQRSSVLAIVHELADEALSKSVVLSGWTPLGMVEHLAHAERHWFEEVALGAAEPLPWADDHAPLTTPRAPAIVFDFYRTQRERSNEIIARTPLTTPPAGRHDEPWADDVTDLRWIILHMIEETARHAGHLDIARELLDGRTGLGPR